MASETFARVEVPPEASYTKTAARRRAHLQLVRFGRLVSLFTQGDLMFLLSTVFVGFRSFRPFGSLGVLVRPLLIYD